MAQLAILFFVPFLGTMLGSMGVFFLPNGMKEKTEKMILGFASGVMIAAAVWSLLLPALESSGYFAVSFGFLLGILFLLAMDFIVPHLHATSDHPEGMKASISRSALLMLSVTIHNLPEGMAVGAGAAVMGAQGEMAFASSLALSLGIALQNFPEGMVVSMPLYKEGKSKMRAFIQGTLSGIVEPIGSIVAFIFISKVISLLPIMLSFAAGAMFYVVVEELIPEASEGEHSNIGTIGASLGFVAMMILDGIFG